MPVLPSYRNQSLDLHNKSIDWFLYEGNTGTYWVKQINTVLEANTYIFPANSGVLAQKKLFRKPIPDLFLFFPRSFGISLTSFKSAYPGQYIGALGKGLYWYFISLFPLWFTCASSKVPTSCILGSDTLQILVESFIFVLTAWHSQFFASESIWIWVQKNLFGLLYQLRSTLHKNELFHQGFLQ